MLKLKLAKNKNMDESRTTLVISHRDRGYGGPSLHKNTNSNLPTSQENKDRMIAAEVLITKFSQYTSSSKSVEDDQTQLKDITSESGSSSSNNTIRSSSPNNNKKTISTSTDINDGIITATTTTATNNVNNVNVITSAIKCNFSSSSSSSSSNKISGFPQTFGKQQQQPMNVECYSGHTCKTTPKVHDNIFAHTHGRRISDNHVIFLEKHNSEPLEQQVNRLACHEKKIEHSHECLPSTNEPNNNNDGHQHHNIINTGPNNANNNQRKKSLPVYNARILKALLNSKNNSKLVYLIHPCNDNFLIRSINKEDFIVSYLELKHRLSRTNQVFNKPQISDSDLLATKEKHVWGVLKSDISIQFFEPTTLKEGKTLNNTNTTNNNHIVTTEHSQENNTCESSNKESDKSLWTSSPTIELSVIANEKPASTLPLKKRKVAASILTPYSRTTSPTSIAHKTSRSIKSVSELAEDCIKDRSVFIISPSDVPKLVESVSSTPRDDNNTNHQLTKSIEIALQQDKDGDLPLHIATVHKNLKMVAIFGMLIQRAGKSVDRFNKKNLTPLHLCVKVKFLEGLRKLIEMGADVNSLDGNGRSALHIAVFNSDFDGFDFMLRQCSLYVKDPKMKPNLNSHDYEGLTLLHTAVNNKNVKLIEKLLEEGAELDSIDFKSGRTPLFHAVENNHMEIVEFLLGKKASIDMPNFAGNTAFLAAYARGYHEISKLLAENGADTRGLLPVEEFTSSNLKTTSAVKTQLKNKLVPGNFSSFSDDLERKETNVYHQTI